MPENDWQEAHTDRDQWTSSSRPVLLAEASSLGLAPGEWPRFITVKFERYRLRVTYERHRKRIIGTTFAGYEYVPATKPWPPDALGLVVFND